MEVVMSQRKTYFIQLGAHELLKSANEYSIWFHQTEVHTAVFHDSTT